MSLHTEIKQFLAAVKDPANLTTTRVSLEQAVWLLGRIQVDPDITGAKCTIYDLTPALDVESAISKKLVEMGWTPPKPEDKL